MISLINKENLNLGILKTDFEIYRQIIENEFSDDVKKNYLLDIENYIIPDYFNNRLTVALQTNNLLIGYAIFEFINSNNVINVLINKINILDSYKDKNFEIFLVESIIYISGEVGSRNALIKIKNENNKYELFKNMGFYEIGINEEEKTLTVNVTSYVSSRKLNDKFRSIPNNFINYKDLRLVKKITSGRSGDIYLTSDDRILKVFTTTSFLDLKEKEETLKRLMEINIKEIVKPKNLVYYDGIFIGYIMDYLPDGKDFWTLKEKFSFEEKINKLKQIEKVMKKLHENKIYINDLDSSNIFFDYNGNIKLIDCDSFIVSDNTLNNEQYNKYKDPYNKIVGVNTDIYALAIVSLEIFINEKIPNNSSSNDIQKIFNKHKGKFPISFKLYFNNIFKTDERYYLTESYENYINNIYNQPVDEELLNERSGMISVIVLSVLLVLISVIIYFILINLK